MHSAVALHKSAHAWADEVLAGQPDVLTSPEDPFRCPVFSFMSHASLVAAATSPSVVCVCGVFGVGRRRRGERVDMGECYAGRTGKRGKKEGGGAAVEN